MDFSKIQVIPTMIDQYRETFEGSVEPGVSWITDGKRESAIFGTLDTLTFQQAFAEPVLGTKSVAAHTEHLRYSLAVMMSRMGGVEPPMDWPSSFNVPPASEQAWTNLKDELRKVYKGVLDGLQDWRDKPLAEFPPIYIAGLCSTVAHNAYHLGAIRQIARVVQDRCALTSKA